MNALVEAWQAALAAEQQAAFGYGLLGPQLPDSHRELAGSCSSGHHALIVSTSSALARAGHAPLAPQVDYPALYPVHGSTAANALAVRLETDCAVAWRYLYALAAATAGTEATARRQDAQTALTASAVRAVRWRGSSVAFPGI